MDDEKLSVKITIADRKYPLKILRKNEEQIRKAASIINDTLWEYKDFTDRDIQDKLAISAIRFVSRLIDVEENKSLSSLQKELKDLDSELESYLNRQVL
jgi:cell division protein ZapA